MEPDEIAEPPAGAVAPPPRARIAVELDPRVNFALEQNDVPVVKRAVVENAGDAPLEGLELRLRAEPAFAEPWLRALPRLEPGASLDLGHVDLVLSPAFLARIGERAGALLVAELVPAAGGEPVAREALRVELLAADEWSGLASLPEILAAFVTPNRAAVQRVLAEAARALEEETGDPSLAGYATGDPERVARTAAAVCAALGRMELRYAPPPASFEEGGQRVRLPDAVLAARLATCLDLALLAAACLEQAGLHPLVVLVRGHAFAGVWLTEETFAVPALDDGLALRKRVELGECLVFDPTGVTARPPWDFARAVAEGRRRLERAEDFLCAIDVARARRGRIRPLPEAAPEGVPSPAAAPASGLSGPTGPTGPSAARAATPASAGSVPAPAGATTRAPDTGAPAAADEPETPASRLDRWKRKLVDLSLRNRLLNFRPGKKSLPLLVRDLGALEDALADGAAFRVEPRPRELSPDDPRDAELYRRRTGEDPLAPVLADGLARRRLFADLDAEELERRLVECWRASRTELEEGGATALYLALGFLSWFETEAGAVERRAPLLLLPLTLARRSVKSGFELSLSDEDPRVNVSLLEMLRQERGIEVPGLDPLPEDESGVDVAHVLRAFRAAVRDVPRWSVVEEAAVGFFSFAKFLMWRDLAVRADALLANPVVSHLVRRPEQWFEPDAPFPAAEELDRTRRPEDTFCPLSADSSQLAAVFAAADGRSFVLEGPPGTGKSQTIANLVCHALAEGRTVLFVSEKMAALEVVHRRLAGIGLAGACLELHSNKAAKRRVVGELGRVLEARGTSPARAWAETAARLSDLRAGLNAYAGALHERRPAGLSAFRATARLVGLAADGAREVELGLPRPLDVEERELAELTDLAGRLVAAAEGARGVVGHPFAAAGRAEWSPSLERDVAAAIERLRGTLAPLRAATRAVAPELGLSGPEPDAPEPGAGTRFADHELAAELAAELAQDRRGAAPVPAALLEAEREGVRAALEEAARLGADRDRLRGVVLARYGRGVLELELEALRSALRAAERAWWPAAWWKRRGVRAQLRTATAEGAPPPGDALARDVDDALALRDAERACAAAAPRARELAGRRFEACERGERPWSDLGELVAWAERLRGLALRAAGTDLERAGALRARWARLVSDGAELLAPEGVLGLALARQRAAFAAWAEAARALGALLELDADAAFAPAPAPAPAFAPEPEPEPDDLARVERALARWSAELPRLREWCAWRRARAAASARGLGELAELLERGELAPRELPAAFERSFLTAWRAALLEREPLLCDFSRAEHERAIALFRQTDDRHGELAGELVAQRLAARVPSPSGAVAATSETGILRKELAKKTRHMSVRRLFASIPNLLPRLKPCLLMSPMSVAQYLDPDHPPFDLVVFDEASQIPPWDAVGAIARGRQAVVVGDSRQLPPTSFFQRAGDDEEDEEGELLQEDQESILDECVASGLRALSLRWHYRSRHESLIAFSNACYYENRLLTFPSPLREGLGVTWRHVADGVYDRARSRTNRREAEEVVAELARRLRDPARAGETLGVVTLSQAQQALVLDLLDELRRRDPELDRALAEDAPEALFVKNLENVQGDERDAILFSVGYGRDAAGRVSLNFGPLNREGGERRLNVAVTRARRELLVFSSLRPQDIDLARTQMRGAADLKAFLEYAERGPAALAARAAALPDAEPDSPFEEDVRRALEGRGYEVHLQVGCSGYRVDLGVVDPAAPGRYLAGVECDGATYHRAKTARDRDKLREAVLRGLGWELVRVWSTDWLGDRAGELERLVAALEAIRARRAAAQAARDAAAATGATGADGASAASAGERAAEGALGPAAPRAEEAGRGAASPERLAEPPAPRSEPAPARAAARPYPTSPGRRLGEPEDLHAPAAAARVRRALREAVEREGPLALELAVRRVAARFGLDRVTARTRERVRELLPDEVVARGPAGDEFLWPRDLDPAAWRDFRTAGADDAAARTPAELPLEEVRNAARHALAAQVALPQDDLARETARLLGFARMGTNVRERMLAGIALLAAEGGAKREGDTVVAP